VSVQRFIVEVRSCLDSGGCAETIVGTAEVVIYMRKQQRNVR
jgi:hypothetical protein